MSRELLAEEINCLHPLMTEELETLYASGLNTVVGSIMARWASGEPAPGPDARVLNVHVKHEGRLVGFRFYLVMGEPMSLGPAPVENI